MQRGVKTGRQLLDENFVRQLLYNTDHLVKYETLVGRPCADIVVERERGGWNWEIG